MRIVSILLGLAIATMGMAQTSFTPTLRQGMVKNYELVSDLTTSSDRQNAKAAIKVDSRMEVGQVAADSVVMSYTYTSCDITGSPAMQKVAESYKVMLNKPIRFSVNPDGSFRHLLNASEIMGGLSDEAKQIAADFANDEGFKSVLDQALITILFGKTIKSGDKMSYSPGGLFNIERDFTSVEAKEVVFKDETNMTEDALKETFRKVLEKNGADVSNFDSTWSMVKSMGIADVKLEGHGRLLMGDDNWLVSGETEQTTEKFGVSMTARAKITQK